MRKLLIIQLVIWLLSPLSVFAGDDGFAGPDRELLSAACGGESKGVRIGTVAYAEGGCFKWEPATGLEDPNSGVTNAAPKQTTTYTLTWTRADGKTNVDNVVVTVKNQLDGDPKVEATKCCYMVGDGISLSDFTFQPAGIESCVELKTTSVPTDFNPFDKTMDVEFSFKPSGDETPKEFKTQINVIPAAGTSIGGKINEVQKTIDDAKKSVDRINRLKKQLSKLPVRKVKSTGAQPGNDIVLTASLANQCCSKCDKEPSGVKATLSLSGESSISNTINARLYGVPYLAEAGARLVVKGGVNVAVNADYVFDCDEGKLSVPVKIYVSVSGGVYAVVAVIIDMSAMVELSLTGEMTWDVLPQPKLNEEIKGNACGEVKLVGSVVVASLIERKLEYTICKKCLK